MSLADAAKRAREIADRSIDPTDHRVALALEGAVAADHASTREPADLTGIPDAAQAGYASNILIPPSATEN